MKRLILVCLVLTVLAGCAPKVGPQRIRWMTELDPTQCFFVAQEYQKETGEAIEVILTQAPDGTTSEIQAMFAAGNPPHVYSAYGGRTSQYYDEAIPLKLDEGIYIPGMLDLVKNSKGEIVGVPIFYWLQSGGMNPGLAAKYGLEELLPQGEERTWTIEQFETLGSAFRSRAVADEYVGFIYAASGSGDYWVQMFEKGLGAWPLYDPAGKLDVGKLKPAWLKFKEWVNLGWLPAGVEGLNDDMFVSARGADKLLFAGTGPVDIRASMSWACSYPSLDGSFVPFAVAPTVHMVVRTGAMDAKAKKFVEWLAQPKWLDIFRGIQWPTRLDQEVGIVPPADASPEQIAMAEENVAWAKAMLKKYGVMNIGIGSTAYQNIRTLRATKLAELFAGKDVDVALDEFQREGEAFLAK